MEIIDKEYNKEEEEIVVELSGCGAAAMVNYALI